MTKLTHGCCSTTINNKPQNTVLALSIGWDNMLRSHTTNQRLTEFLQKSSCLLETYIRVNSITLLKLSDANIYKVLRPFMDRMTMPSFAIALYGQCYRRHVARQWIVSNISVVRSCWSIVVCVLNLTILMCYYACSLLYHCETSILLHIPNGA